MPEKHYCGSEVDKELGRYYSKGPKGAQHIMARYPPELPEDNPSPHGKLATEKDECCNDLV